MYRLGVTFLAAVFSFANAFGADPAPRELEITEVIRGPVAYLGDAGALDEAHENHGAACEAWMDAVRSTITQDLIYVDCGGRADTSFRTSYQYIEVDHSTNTSYYATKYQEPFAVGSASEGKILILSPKRVRMLDVAVRGEKKVCQLANPASCLRAKQEADQTYVTACETWKAQAKSGMGARFLYASCHTPKNFAGQIDQRQYGFGYESTGTIYYYID